MMYINCYLQSHCEELVNILISIFAVKGDRDANIMFCPCDGCDGYRVLIGGWGNQKSFIRDNKNDGNLQTLVDVRLQNISVNIDKKYDIFLQTPDILSTTEYRRFIINFISTPTEFKIEVRKDGECSSFLQRSWGADSMPWPMANYIAFSGYTDKPMDFRFPTSGIAAVLTLLDLRVISAFLRK